jgi:hypothetical protein
VNAVRDGILGIAVQHRDMPRGLGSDLAVTNTMIFVQTTKPLTEYDADAVIVASVILRHHGIER